MDQSTRRYLGGYVDSANPSVRWPT